MNDKLKYILIGAVIGSAIAALYAIGTIRSALEENRLISDNANLERNNKLLKAIVKPVKPQTHVAKRTTKPKAAETAN